MKNEHSNISTNHTVEEHSNVTVKTQSTCSGADPFHNILSNYTQKCVCDSYLSCVFTGRGYSLHKDDIGHLITIRSIIQCIIRSQETINSHGTIRPLGVYFSSYHMNITLSFINEDGQFFNRKQSHAFDSFNNSPAFLRTLCTESHKLFNTAGEIIVGFDNTSGSKKLHLLLMNLLPLFTNVKATYVHSVTVPQFLYVFNKVISYGPTDTMDGPEKTRFISSLTEEYTLNLIRDFLHLKSLTNNSLHLCCDAGLGPVKSSLDIVNESIETYIDLLPPSECDVDSKYKRGAHYIYLYKGRPKVAHTACLAGSIDNIADALLFYKESGDNLRIFDGDTLMCYIATYIKNIIDSINSRNIGVFAPVSLEVILTNLSSTVAINFLKHRNILITREKHNSISEVLNENTNKKTVSDIRICWRPSGHGSVLFTSKGIEKLNDILANLLATEEPNSVTNGINILLTLYKLFNQACSDALANLLVCKGILRSHYDLNLYKPSSTRVLTIQITKEIKIDRNRVINPIGIQKYINAFIRKYNGRIVLLHSQYDANSRSEITVYAESSKDTDCDILCLKVADLLYEEFGGIGGYPMVKYQHLVSTFDQD